MKKKMMILAMITCLVSTNVSAAEYSTLQVGSNGVEVQQMQQALIEQGFLSGAADGSYGNGTAAGVSAFQEIAGLEVTGIANEETLRKLYNDEVEDISGIEVKLSGTTETDHMKINGIFVDDSYIDSKNENMTMLYVCYSAFTNNENYKIDSKASELKINDVNTYTSEHYPGICRYLENYYYSDYLKDVYVGDANKNC